MTMTQPEAIRMALDALKDAHTILLVMSRYEHGPAEQKVQAAIAALKQSQPAAQEISDEQILANHREWHGDDPGPSETSKPHIIAEARALLALATPIQQPGWFNGENLIARIDGELKTANTSTKRAYDWLVKLIRTEANLQALADAGQEMRPDEDKEWMNTVSKKLDQGTPLNYGEQWKLRDLLDALYRSTPTARSSDPADCAERLSVGQRAEKVGGSYQAAGTIKAVFEADDGSVRYVFRFDQPAGLLHIFGAAQLKGHADSAGNDEPLICWSADEENFNQDSLEELIDHFELEVDAVVYFGEAVKPTTKQLCDAGDIIDIMGDRACDIAGEHADGYPDVSKEAEQELDVFLSAWIMKHCPPGFYSVKNVKPYTISAEDMEGQS